MEKKVSWGDDDPIQGPSQGILAYLMDKEFGRILLQDALKSWAVPGATLLSPKAVRPPAGAVAGDVVGSLFLSGLTQLPDG